MTEASRMRLHVRVVDSRRISPVPAQIENCGYTAGRTRTRERKKRTRERKKADTRPISRGHSGELNLYG